MRHIIVAEIGEVSKSSLESALNLAFPDADNNNFAGDFGERTHAFMSAEDYPGTYRWGICGRGILTERNRTLKIHVITIERFMEVLNAR